MLFFLTDNLMLVLFPSIHPPRHSVFSQCTNITPQPHRCCCMIHEPRVILIVSYFPTASNWCSSVLHPPADCYHVIISWKHRSLSCHPSASKKHSVRWMTVSIWALSLSLVWTITVTCQHTRWMLTVFIVLLLCIRPIYCSFFLSPV